MPSPFFNFASIGSTALELSVILLFAFVLFAIIYPLTAKWSPRRTASFPSRMLFPIFLLALAGLGHLLPEAAQLTNNRGFISGLFFAFVVLCNLPLVFSYCRSARMKVPPSLSEAAALDGASASQRFLHLSLPLILPVLSVGFFLTCLQTFAAWLLFSELQPPLAAVTASPVSSKPALLIAGVFLCLAFIVALVLEARTRRPAIPPDEARPRVAGDRAASRAA
ncbi:MAG: hypothetical protein ABI839_03515 [Verrucomicrobiota bacterium]